MNEMILTTKSLSKRYGSFYALKDIDIHVEKGKIYGLVGQNGAGKTTLMKIVSGFASETSGEVTMFDREEGQKRIGVLLESPGLYGGRNAYENMKLKAIGMGMYDKQKILDILDLVGLSTTGKKKAKHYSLGMKQRLGIGLALIGNPDLLILDEPINGLDPQGIIEVRGLLLNLCREKGMTIIVSSHILEELAKVADTIGILHKGELLAELSAEEMKRQCDTRVEIITPQAERAIVALEDMGIREYTAMEKNKIYAYHCTERRSEMMREFVSRDIPVEQISAAGASLEEFFLNLISTKGEQRR